jgi:hypothetical protein
MTFKSIWRAYFVPRSRVVEFGIGIGTALVVAGVALFCLDLYNGLGLVEALFSPIFLIIIFGIAPVFLVPIGTDLDHSFRNWCLLVVLLIFVADFFLRGLWLRSAIFVLTLAWLVLGAWAAGSNF